MITWLVGEQALAYAHLTTGTVAMVLPQVQAPQGCLQLTAGCPHFAAGLRFAGMPAGLAVLRWDPRAQDGDIYLLSLVVAKQLRGLGLARDLLAWIRGELKRLGWSCLTMSYPVNHGSSSAMEKLTSSAKGWHHRPGLQLLHLNRDGAQQLFQRLTPGVIHAQRSGRFRLSRWADLPPADQCQFGHRLGASPRLAPAEVLGDDALSVLDLNITTVLHESQQPAGCLIVHRVGPRLLRVSDWWVEPGLQGTGAGLLLLHQALAGALESPHGDQSFAFGMQPESTQAIRLCQRKIEPFALRISRQRRARLRL
jgi:GNAT superfamily N-acetyltransferase